MADLGIAHLAVRQPDMMLRRVQPGMWTGRLHPVPDRRTRQGDGISFAFRPLAPAVQNAENDRAWSRFIAHGLILNEFEASMPVHSAVVSHSDRKSTRLNSS